ncbi:MAG: nucleotidyltransferase [Syntrophomonadaceae bacterium]|nr:nucleotidyltransferase [Syntrophomonadaceae bacterium]
MSVLGIIAEFNPLHNGHKHFIQSARQSHDFSATICVMSGNFVQRGEAAMCNKWMRTRMALQAGVDLVIELPFSFAVRSAYFFARGAVQLLYRTGVVSHLAFGSESGQLEQLQSIAAMITKESQEYKNHLKHHLTEGLSFPAARSQTIQEIMGKQIANLEYTILQPNNILALEYLRVLEQESIPIQPFTIPRVGSGYNCMELSPYASASAIRSSLLQHPSCDDCVGYMPADILALLQEEINAGRAPVSHNSLGLAILTKLRTMSRSDLSKIYEITEGLEHRIKAAAVSNGTLEELRQAIKSKRYSLTRINRLLLYSLLDIETEQMLRFDQHGPLYLHILGFSTQGRKILQDIKNKSTVRLISRGSEVKSVYLDDTNPIRQAMLGLDLKSTDIYTLLYPSCSERQGSLDYTTSPLRLDN